MWSWPRIPAEAFWYWALLLAVVAVRLALCGQYLLLGTRNPSDPTRKGWSALSATLRQTTTELSLRRATSVTADKARQRHTALLAAARRQQATILTVGSLALAAWTQFAAAGDGSLASRLPDTTRSLLFVGVIALIAGSVLFRAEGSHITYIGREAAYAAGYAAIVLSLASAIRVVLSLPAWIGLALAALVMLRDWTETLTLMRLDRTLLAKPEPSPPADATPDATPDAAAEREPAGSVPPATPAQKPGDEEA